MKKANEVINVFSTLFGENNVEILDKYESDKKIVIEFVLFKEIYFSSVIDKQVNDDILESQIKSQYNEAKIRLKDLLLKIDRYLINEIMPVQSGR